MATQEAFNAAMQRDDTKWLIENTFMARVPELVAGGMSIEEAIVAAKKQEDELCEMLFAPCGYRQEEIAKEVKAQMCERVYHRLRANPVPIKINPRWLECEAAIGHMPTAHEFILWHYTKGC